ncbi:MAG: bifunctional phosphoribosylaminoimidazolecarboxamide formyltransferase/IMP cyclohydrolase [Phycisphaerae bacterium]
MASLNIQRALISVYDKRGIVQFARALSSEFGVEIISTGGTARLLKENKVPVTLVEEVTGFPEMMDGRVKTLHPKIHAAILADRDNPEHMRQLEQQGIKPIDMVVVNLYPFAETTRDPDCAFEKAIEMIDIGGPCLIRAAAKNHKHVLVVPDVSFYDDVLDVLGHPSGAEQLAACHAMSACAAFGLTEAYDETVADWLAEQVGPHEFADVALRYGENPHQNAFFTTVPADDCGEASLGKAAVVGESEVGLSYNNYTDAAAALEVCKELTRANRAEGRAVCTFIKHTNACGVGVADDPAEAYRRAYLGDPNAAMGGILACSFEVTNDFADLVMHTYDRLGKQAGAGGFFAEVWMAPAFAEGAVEVISSAKPWGRRVRLLELGDMLAAPDDHDREDKTIVGGILSQSRDLLGLNEDQWEVVTRRAPTDAEWADLRLAWLVCKHTKSNAITICRDNMLIGNGAGQMSRVMSCRIATWLAKENGHGDRLAGAVAASDAFFPFSDGPEILTNAGVRAIIQPGGSKRDDDSISTCNERDVAMIFTGTRHFKH